MAHELPSEQSQMRARDELIERGAWVDINGRLVLADEQIELLTLTAEHGIDATAVDRSAPPPHPLDEWLDSSIEEATNHVLGSATNEAYDYLRRASYHTARDLLTTGKLNTLGVRTVGFRRIALLSRAFAAHPNAPAWEDEPSPEHIATFCSRLTQVHAGALMLGDPAGRISVLDVLDAPLKKRPYMFQPLATLGHAGHVSLRRHIEASNRPELFAVRFTIARRAIENA